MPAVDPKAILEPNDIRRAMAHATKLGFLEAALFAWMYEFGARAAEPGLQVLNDIDMRSARARAIHLKTKRGVRTGVATKSEWHSLLPYCLRALPPWLQVRSARVKDPSQAQTLFPSAMGTHCYTCAGSGSRPILKQRPNGERYTESTAPCHHCNATGLRPGISRIEVHTIITRILSESGASERRRHPHVLRHTIITHLLEGGIAPTTVQDRVGHASLKTTLDYVRATRAAAAQMEGALSKIGLYDDD